MKKFKCNIPVALLTGLALAVSGCASSGEKHVAQQFDAPAKEVAAPDKDLFDKASKAQKEGRHEAAVTLWKSFLAKNPDSFTGHNNLGMVYYNQDMLSQALEEFEVAYRLQSQDPLIRKNLARALRFKANMFHENREYFKTLEILKRLEGIVEPEGKQALLFKQEQVEDQIFLQVIKADNSEAYNDFVERFPDGLNAVRAREYLAEHPYKVSKSVSQNKSWLSSGKTAADPGASSGNVKSWLSAEKPPQNDAPQTSATYTPPASGPVTKKKSDLFGIDPNSEEKIIEGNLGADEAPAPIAIPLDDFQKPERAEGATAAAEEPGKEDRMAMDAPATERGVPNAALDTSPDLTMAEAEASPEEAAPDQTAEAPAGDIQTQPGSPEEMAASTTPEAGPESQTPPEENPAEQPIQEAPEAVKVQEEPAPAAETAPAEVSPEVQAEIEKALKEPVEEASANDAAEKAQAESTESEAERIARIVREELAKEEGSASAEPAPSAPEPVEEKQAEPAPQEEPPVETASLPEEAMTAPQETIPAPSAEEHMDQETLTETVASLVPKPQISAPQAAPAESAPQNPAGATMVVIRVSEGATLNVRSAPSSSGEVLGYLERGDMMPFVSEKNGWYEIEVEKGLTGWVSAKFSGLETVGAENLSPATEPEAEGETLAGAEPMEEPEPAEETGNMVVIKVREGSSLNVRSMPSATGAVVDMVMAGDMLPLVSESGDWYQIQFEDETTGWVSKQFASLVSAPGEAADASEMPDADPVPAPAQEKVAAKKSPASKSPITTVVVIKVKEGTSLNVRSAPSSQGEVMGSLKSGDMRPLLEESGEWYQVELQDGTTGWVSRKFTGKMDLTSNVVPGL